VVGYRVIGTNDIIVAVGAHVNDRLHKHSIIGAAVRIMAEYTALFKGRMD
jgi:hypothetical protein